MNEMEYGEANPVPFAVPQFNLNVCLFWELEVVVFKTISVNSSEVSVVTLFFSVLSKCFLIGVRPSSCGILKYRPAFWKNDLYL